MYYVSKIIIETSLNVRSLYFISKRKRYFTLFHALQFDRNIYIYLYLSKIRVSEKLRLNFWHSSEFYFIKVIQAED